MTDLNKKQAFWAEQLPSFKENYICLAQLEAVQFNNETGSFDALTKDATGFDLEDILEAYHSVNTGWAMWLRAKAQAVPEQTINEIQSWIAVESIQAMELDGEEFVVGANELAEFIEQLVKSESGAEG